MKLLETTITLIYVFYLPFQIYLTPKQNNEIN